MATYMNDEDYYGFVLYQLQAYYYPQIINTNDCTNLVLQYEYYWSLNDFINVIFSHENDDDDNNDFVLAGIAFLVAALAV